jgi:acid phosphatase (class A)
MKQPLVRALLLCALAWPWTAPARAAIETPSILMTQDWAALVGPFPTPGSPAAESDLAVLLWLQHTRTREDVARAEQGVMVSLETFTGALGRPLEPSRFPRTAALLAKASLDVAGVLEPLKHRYLRPRPFHSHPVLTPVVCKEPSHSYPSGHATRGVLYAAILAELAPERRAAILELGHRLGNDRAVAGVHWPSDIHAGQQLGAAFAGLWLAQEKQRELLGAALLAEWSPVEPGS